MLPPLYVSREPHSQFILCFVNKSTWKGLCILHQIVRYTPHFTCMPGTRVIWGIFHLCTLWTCVNFYRPRTRDIMYLVASVRSSVRKRSPGWTVWPMTLINVKGQSVQPGERTQTDRQTKYKYQVHYLPASRSIIIKSLEHHPNVACYAMACHQTSYAIGPSCQNVLTKYIAKRSFIDFSLVSPQIHCTKVYHQNSCSTLDLWPCPTNLPFH